MTGPVEMGRYTSEVRDYYEKKRMQNNSLIILKILIYVLGCFGYIVLNKMHY